MKPKKDNRSIGTVIIVGAAFLIFVTVFLLSQKGSTGSLLTNDTLGINISGKPGNASVNCPTSDSGIPLCELTPEQREKEELKDRLNRELAGMQNEADDADPYAPVKKPAQGIALSATSSVRLRVAIPGSDHASLVAEDLRNDNGIADVYWSPPNLYDIKYDSARTSVGKILARDIFKRYNATVVNAG
jgi:hypothetical protein